MKSKEMKRLGVSSDELSSPPNDASSTSDRKEQIEYFVT